jgi:hypothetical protein
MMFRDRGCGRVVHTERPALRGAFKREITTIRADDQIKTATHMQQTTFNELCVGHRATIGGMLAKKFDDRSSADCADRKAIVFPFLHGLVCKAERGRNLDDCQLPVDACQS